MDDDSSDTESSSLFQQVWKFGSMGPEIYDEIILGIPYTEASDSTTGVDESEDVSIEIPYLYEDDDFSTPIWNQSAGESIPSKYIEYNQSDYAYFVNGSSAICDENDTNLTNGTGGYCYINKSSNMLWIKIPHFSGIQPTVSGSILKENTDPCSSDSECYTGNCRDDYDTDGDGDGTCEDGEDCWCAPDDYCAHNGNVYADNYDTCYGDYLTSCDQGEWDMTECSYDCDDGECVSQSSTSTTSTYTTTDTEEKEYLEITSDLDMEIKQGESDNLTVIVENNYNIDLDNIELTITGLDNYTVEPEELEIESDETGSFVVSIFVDNTTEIGEYDFTVKAASLTRETEKDGTLTVLASEETQNDINQTYNSLKQNITDLENRIDSMDLENKEDVEKTLNSLKSKQNDIELAIENKDYALAESLISDAKQELDSLELKQQQTEYMKWAGIILIIFVLAIGLFLLANKPDKKYEPGTYKYKKKKTVEEISRDIRRKLGKK